VIHANDAVQVLYLGIAVVIIAAKVFWQQSDDQLENIRLTSNLYFPLGTAIAVNREIFKHFESYPGSSTMDSKYWMTQLLQIAMENQMGVGVDVDD